MPFKRIYCDRSGFSFFDRISKYFSLFTWQDKISLDALQIYTIHLKWSFNRSPFLIASVSDLDRQEESSEPIKNLSRAVLASFYYVYHIKFTSLYSLLGVKKAHFINQDSVDVRITGHFYLIMTLHWSSSHWQFFPYYPSYHQPSGNFNACMLV